VGRDIKKNHKKMGGSGLCSGKRGSGDCRKQKKRQFKAWKRRLLEKENNIKKKISGTGVAGGAPIRSCFFGANGETGKPEVTWGEGGTVRQKKRGFL